MEKNYFNGSNGQCVALDLDEMMSIDGGGVFEAIRDFAIGFRDGLLR
jgi:hypothetical protein